MVRRLWQRDVHVCVLELDKVDISEDVLAVRPLVAFAFLEGTSCLAPLDQPHHRIMRRDACGR